MFNFIMSLIGIRFLYCSMVRFYLVYNEDYSYNELTPYFEVVFKFWQWNKFYFIKDTFKGF